MTATPKTIPLDEPSDGVPNSAPEDVELTILMPCLNEAETLDVCIGKALGYLQRSGVSGEVLIADNGSTDGSQDIARSLGARVVDVPRRGYGAALIGGIEAARGSYIIMGDADDSYDFSQLDGFVKELRGGADVVMGNRFQGGIAPKAMPPLHRYFGNPVLSFVGRLFFNLPVRDFHCGLRGFNTASIRRLDLIATGMEFASEMVLRAGTEGYKMVEVPTTLKPDGRSRPPHLKSFRDGWRHLKLLLMYSPKWLFLYPGALLLAIGALLAGVLSFGPLHLDDDLVLDINTFVAACFMMISGVQLLSFGVIARFYASITGMLPTGPRSNIIRKHLTTDGVVRIAAVLLVLGLVIFGFAATVWARAGLGELVDPLAPRAVVAGLTLVVIAIQLGFQAFLVGILQIPTLRSR